jgi:hypothetical protein
MVVLLNRTICDVMNQFFVNLYIALRDFTKYVWPAVGPLIGVLVGAYLAKSSDRKKWLSENRKQECQELLGAITACAVTILSDFSRTEDIQRFASYVKTIEVFHTRIFIAGDVEKEKLEERWAHAVHDFGLNWVRKSFDDALEGIRAKIIRIAMKQP